MSLSRTRDKLLESLAGIPVIEELIANGVNVNATLIFSVAQYEQVAKAYYQGLLRRAADGLDLSGIRSVASIFISRIDTAVDKLIDAKMAEETDESGKEKLQSQLYRLINHYPIYMYPNLTELPLSHEFYYLFSPVISYPK